MLEKLEKLMESYTGSRVSLSEDMDLTKDLGLNSMDLIQMVVGVEEEFGIEISDRELKDIATVGDIVAMINSHKK
ncbi:MAG: acyl carrier protein [Clostridia bacterium]|nr:acyl carrier protein [Clostridia bacterium]